MYRNAIVLFFLCLTSCQAVITGEVVAVADGDTMTILTSDQEQIKVRLHGIDCPEKKQDFGYRAKQFTSDLVFGQTVQIQVREKDRYGRSVGIVILQDGRVLNKELLEAGMAWHYKHYDESEEFAELERCAREKGIGLWRLKTAVAPWEFRKRRLQRSREQTEPIKYRSDPSPRCGAPAKTTGTPCNRVVRDGRRCYQHA